LLVRLT